MTQTAETELWLFFPRPMVEEMFALATKLDESASQCVTVAWQHAYAALQGPDASDWIARAGATFRERYPMDAEKLKQLLILPRDVVKQMRDEAARQDRSTSWMVQHAWCAHFTPPTP